jgi:hypothetical protein
MKDPQLVQQEQQQQQQQQMQAMMAEPQLKTQTDLQKTKLKTDTELKVAGLKANTERGKNLDDGAEKDADRKVKMMDMLMKAANDRKKSNDKT